MHRQRKRAICDLKKSSQNSSSSSSYSSNANQSFDILVPINSMIDDDDRDDENENENGNENENDDRLTKRQRRVQSFDDVETMVAALSLLPPPFVRKDDDDVVVVDDDDIQFIWKSLIDQQLARCHSDGARHALECVDDRFLLFAAEHQRANWSIMSTYERFLDSLCQCGQQLDSRTVGCAYRLRSALERHCGL
jgi:hypothetical protein